MAASPAASAQQQSIPSENVINNLRQGLSHLFIPIGITVNPPNNNSQSSWESDTSQSFHSINNPSPTTNDSLLFDDLFPTKSGHRPASKSSIEAMETVEIGENEKDEQCAICLEEWGQIDHDNKVVVKEMPCKHRFHGNCIEKWLNIHGNCPVCRYQMPLDDHDPDRDTKTSNEPVAPAGNGNGDDETTTTRSSGRRREEHWFRYRF